MPVVIHLCRASLINNILYWCHFLTFCAVLQVLELQNTLDDLMNRVDAVKEENLKLRSENTVLGQYIENLMQASAVFQTVSPKSGRKDAGNGRKETGSAAAGLGSVVRCTARAVKGAQAASSHQ